MACKSVKYKGTKTVSKKGLIRQQQDPCCNPQPGCVIPVDETTGNLIVEDLIPECIFVDKVHDAVLVNTQFPIIRNGANAVNTGIAVAGRTISSLEIVSCRPVRNPQDPCRLIVTPNSTLSGVTLGNTIIGPGGTEQAEVFLEDDQCAEVIPPRGRRVFGTQETTIEGEVEVTYTVTFTNGNVVTNTVRVPVPAGTTVTNFFELCLPPLGGAAFLPQFVEFCAVDCFVQPLTGGPQDVRVVNGIIVVDTLILLCISCEKKIKAPVQLCVLSTGECEVDVQLPFEECPEFPNIFPIQIEPENNNG